MLRLLVLGKTDPASPDAFSVLVQAVEDTQAAMERAAKSAERRGLTLLDRPRSLYLHDNGGDLGVTASDCAAGWAIKGGKQVQHSMAFNDLWSGPIDPVGGGEDASTPSVGFGLQHVDRRRRQ